MSKRTLFPSTSGAPAAREKAWSASSRIGGALARSIRSRCRLVLIVSLRINAGAPSRSPDDRRYRDLLSGRRKPDRYWLTASCSSPSLVLLVVRDIGFRPEPLRPACDGKVPAASYGDEANPEAESSAGDCHPGGWKIQHVTYYHHYRASQGRNSI